MCNCCLTERKFLVQTSVAAFLSLHVLPVLVWVFSTYSGFLPQFKDMHVRLIVYFKLRVGVIVSVHGCSCTCDPAMDW